MLVEELLNRSRLEKLLRDLYGNYCVQVGVHTHRIYRLLMMSRLHLTTWSLPSAPFSLRAFARFFHSFAILPTANIFKTNYNGGYHGHQMDVLRNQVDNYNGGYHGHQMDVLRNQVDNYNGGYHGHQMDVLRNQVDNYNGGYHGHQMINMNLNGQALGLAHGPAAGRHLPQSIHPNGSIADIYASQASLYGMQGQGSYGPSHLAPQLHGLQARSIDGYVLQNHSPHNASLTPPHTHAGSYSGVSAYVNVSFGNIGLAGSLSALTISPLMPYFYVYSNSLELGTRRYLHVTCCLPRLVFPECPFDLWAMADFLIISHLYFGLAYTITTHGYYLVSS
ncbi:hypothetical protein L210DRAFT_3629494 [Boletus edulis BED1]|uniref:Uncharacterized protein n=1 Tax=Boletus edulis BED1 TaxID=1328754 RepID=A0AAD4GGD8_BOLED|nr:hypothetical protein L210DRAFT_3629494 [Boletus edulis BED1]